MFSRRFWESGSSAGSIYTFCAAFLLLLIATKQGHCQGAFSFEANSTLDAHIISEDLEAKSLVIDFLDNHQLGAPLRMAKVDRKKPALQTKRKSPFQKWVTPKQSTPLVQENPQEEPKQEKVALRADALGRSLNRRGFSKKSQDAIQKSLTKIPSGKTSQEEPEVIEEELNIEARELPKPREQKVEVVNLPPLTNSQKNLRTKIRRVLTHYYNRPLNTRDRSPWEVMHTMLAFEVHSKVLQDGPKGEPITAVGWLCYNRSCKKRSLMYVNDEGKLRVRVGPALQGHRGQLMAMLAQSKISPEYPMLVDDQEFSIADLIRMEMETCYPRTELTFKLIGLSHYLDSDTTWVNDQGMDWDVPQLISEELRQPVRGAACGGTHRLAGLTLAYKNREKRGEPIDGQYLRAQQFVKKYQQYAYRLQNRDGSFSTEWFRGSGADKDVDRRVKTTGHTLEWLLYAATEKELKHWRTTKAVNYLASILYNNRYRDWDSGGLGHAIHALLLYDRAMFQPYDAPDTLPMIATSPSTSTRKRKR